MKLSRWAEASIDVLEANRFHKLKPHQYARIRNGAVQFLSFQGQKQDIHLWINALPLSLPELSLLMGWRKAVGRVPSEEGALHVQAGTADDIERIQTVLREALVEEVLPKLDAMSSLEALHDAFDESSLPSAAWPKAFCMFQAGHVERGKAHLQKVLHAQQRWPDPAIAQHYFDSDSHQIAHLVQLQIAANIKQCRLAALNQ